MPGRKRLKVKGIVQGVGFRPFVYRLAHDLELTGFVRNTTDGVDIEIEGKKYRIAQFIRNLREKKPKAARIDSIAEKVLRPNGHKGFFIKESKISKGFTHISPDIATCSDCLSELNDSTDRRFKFPFINCTNCGPRYSIVVKTPYDRKRTTMRDFKMCPVCKNEFNEITDRRFHAQPDCCAVCGPVFSLYSIKGGGINTNDPISKTAEFLQQGEIVAIKGIGGFHIACDATNCKVVKKLRRLKNRPTKPFAIMAKNIDLDKIVHIDKREHELLNSPATPIMLLKKKKKTVICDEIAPGNPYCGVMVPYVPVHYLLLEKIPFLVMTSANIQDEPIATNDRDVKEKLSGIVSFVLTHNRKIENRCDDSVGFHLPKKGFSIIRRSRGYVPVPIGLPKMVQPTLGVGPYLKNTFTLAYRKDAYVSAHIGDLDNLETLRFFDEMIGRYKKWFKIRPELIVHDLHPDYFSTKIAQNMPGRKIGVQHHVAHIISCLGENRIFDDVIGIAFDGTGFGLDEKIWGGEFFVGNLNGLKRIAHLEYLPLPGGEIAIKKPYRTTIAYLYKLFGRTTNLVPFRIPSQERDIIIRLIKKDHNLVYTSSMGRLFDCVAVMLGLIKEITYEAEAAINLEHITAQNINGKYPYYIKETNPMTIEIKDTLAAVTRDLNRGVASPVIAAKFHNTIVHFSLDVAQKLSIMYDVKKICFSGGVFQNRYLLSLMINTFENAGFEVYTHRRLPTNDGCISYGQVIAGNLISEK